MRFDGETYEARHDEKRLGTQLDLVRNLMLDGKWRSLGRIVHLIGKGTESSVSARLRDLRKSRFGSYVVERRRKNNPERGLFQYRIKI